MQKIILIIIVFASIFVTGCVNTTITNDIPNNTGNIITGEILSGESTTGEIITGEILTGITETIETGITETGIIQTVGQNTSSGTTTSSGNNNEILQAKIRAMIERRNKEMQQEQTKSNNENSGEVTEKDIQLLENIINQISSGQGK